MELILSKTRKQYSFRRRHSGSQHLFSTILKILRVSLFIPQLKIKQIAVDRLLHFGHYVWHKGGKVDKTDIVLHLTQISV